MSTLVIDEEKCIGCGLCEIACAYDAIDVHIKARVDNMLCTDCGVCPDYCPTDAIWLEATPRRSAPSLPATAAFDAVVIGSGLGGICSAALLAHRGYKTLVLERSATLGGRFSSLRHKNVMIPTGGSLIGLGGPLEQVWTEAGAPFDVAPFQTSAYWVAGKGWLDPGSGGGQFRRALTEMAGDAAAANAAMSAMRDALVSQQYPDGTMLEWLKSITDNKGIEQMYRAVTAAAFGPEDVPAADFFSLLAATAGRGMGLARRGQLHLMRDLAETITARGGEVWTRCSATAITTDGKRATGVTVERDGQSCNISAGLVVSNAGPHQTVKLLGREHVDESFLSQLDQQVTSMSSITVHLISDETLLGDIPGAVYTAIGARRIAMIFDASLTAEWSGNARHFTEIYPLTATDPSVPVDWAAQIEEIRLDLDDMCPGWRDRAEMRVITLQGEYPGLRAWPGKGASVETPIPNVFLVGDGCQSVGYAGGAAAASSAQRAVALISERFSPPS
jgi:phytoene dehydrogenase-like protein/NAD-dependent dihydropyrimidine dehydrogenase PreA subunit